ncbi:MAG: hypothetical protein HY075_02480 [Deltaproteobacteria bacterium]|nr:hypothetical protein [Deltaproteobacteria bacterium]
MEISFRSTLFKALLAWAAAAAILFFPKDAFCYNPFSHEMMTRNALNYLRSHAHVYADTDRWLGVEGAYQGFLEETLVRATVDTDYRTDVFLKAWFHDPFTGAQSGDTYAMFTRLQHFIDVTVPGKYWDKDGYNYNDSSRENNDGYLDYPSVTVWGSVSRALGGVNAAHPEHGIPLGKYNLGFKGTTKQWNNLFFYDNDANDAYFPPASTPAQMAFNALVKSDRAAGDFVDSWNDNIPVVTGLFSNGSYNHHYWRGEIKGLPKGFDLLGIVLHLTQDLTVPQHAEGTCDWCHQELEDLSDSLDCGTENKISIKAYDAGNFGAHITGQCGRLYDERIIADILASRPALNPSSNLSVGDRLKAIAFDSARWQWGAPENSWDDFATVLPNGTYFSGESCKELLREYWVRDQLKYQYNYAVAASAVMFELAAHAYEAPRQSLLQRFAPAQLFNLFNLKLF